MEGMAYVKKNQRKSSKDERVFNETIPATLGSKSASSAEAAAHETRGKRKTPAFFESSLLVMSGKENRLTTFMASPTI